MDKKIVARAVLAAKGAASDAKFKQDGQQKFLRTSSRKREGTRPDPQKKPIPQRGRTSNDKRPRPRGLNLWDRDGSQVVEDVLAEAGSTLQHGQKKTNLNHLLNFKLAPREARAQVRENGHHPRLPKYNKEQFLQANCQFVVEEEGDYVRHANDPDLLVDWSHVQEARIQCLEVPSCPICLCQPATAAKLTRCGHIYCWPCILHYLALSDHNWCKCPICHEHVLKDDLKSVMPVMKVAPSLQQDISMCLMRRKKGQLCALPVTRSVEERGLFTVHDDLSTTCFQKLLTATKKDVQQFVIDREMTELQKLRNDADDTSELIFIDESLELLMKRRDSLICENSLDGISESLGAVVLEDESVFAALSVASSETSCDTTTSVVGRSTQDSYFYFYQARDGQHIYLHPLNIRMLVEEYGSLERSPEIITAKIMDIERVTVTESVRRRLRYLQHLPLTCEFKVVELQLQSPLLSATTCDIFGAEVEKRRRFRNRKAREERRRDKRIEAEENRKLGKYPEARYCLSSADHFPSCPNELLSSEDPILGNLETQSPRSEDLEMSSSLETAAGTSFAQMLRSGKVRPDLVRECHPPPPPVQSYVEDVDVEGAAAPAYWQSFSDALDSCAIQQNSGVYLGKGKKKKNKTLLFTTAINRSK